MNIAIIPPTKYLNEFAHYKGNRYHLALAHRVLLDEAYQLFYNNASTKGHFVILDNGACELGESIPKDKLIKAIRLIRPSQVILPDKLNDAEETIKLSYDFIQYFHKFSTQTIPMMAVVQGNTKDEWLHCFKEFSRNNHITTIGISNTNAVFPINKYYFSRVKTIEYLVKENLINPQQNIHLLGLNSSGHLELEQLNSYKFIEGVDTSAPIVHGAFNIRFKSMKRYEKIRKYLDPDSIIASKNIELIYENLELLFNLVNDEPKI